MGLMAITTAYSLGVHLALQERAININLIQNLPVGVVQALMQQLWLEKIVIWLSRPITVLCDGSAGMARSTGLDFGGRILTFQACQPIPYSSIPKQGKTIR